MTFCRVEKTATKYRSAVGPSCPVTELSWANRKLVDMDQTLQTPTRTPLAVHWLEGALGYRDRAKRTLLANLDGHRNVIELESFARAMGLAPDALERLRDQGLIRMTD